MCIIDTCEHTLKSGRTSAHHATRLSHGQTILHSTLFAFIPKHKLVDSLTNFYTQT